MTISHPLAPPLGPRWFPPLGTTPPPHPPTIHLTIPQPPGLRGRLLGAAGRLLRRLQCRRRGLTAEAGAVGRCGRRRGRVPGARGGGGVQGVLGRTVEELVGLLVFA